jgi:hypothetical protein
MKYKITIRQMDGEDIYKGSDIYEQVIEDMPLEAIIKAANGFV